MVSLAGGSNRNTLLQAKRVDDPRTVKYQRGALEIPQAHVGTYRWWRNDKKPEETTVWETEFRVWLHPDLPIGVAHASTKLKLIREGQTRRTWQLDYALQDFGEGARPAIEVDTAPSTTP